MATQHDDVEFEGKIEANSGKAVMFQADLWEKAEWVPRSQCEIVPIVDADEPGRATLYIRRWLCKKNGWIE